MRVLLICGLILGSSAAMAEGGDPLSDRFSVSLGTFLLDTSTRLRVDGTGGRGTEFDAERDLGLRDSDSFRLDGYWRFKERHKLRVLYFDTKRHDSQTIDRDIQIRDTTFPLAAEINTTFDTRVAELAYEYAFLRRDRYEVAGTIGVHDLRFKLAVNATVSPSGAGVARAEKADADGPLPVIGLHGTWRIADRVSLDGQAQFFKISIDPYDGRLEDYTAAVVWMPFRHVGIGAGYNEFVTRLDVSANQFSGRLRWRYGGARIFLTASF